MPDPNQAADRCALPPELDDLALIAAADGEADATVLDHLRECAYCAARARHYMELQGALRKQFFRMFCPPVETLIAFHDGSLSTAQHASVAAHLAECPHCRREQHFLTEITNDAVSGRSPPMQWYTIRAPALQQWQALGNAAPLRAVVALHVSSPTLAADFYGAPRAHAPASQHAYQAENIQISLGIRAVTNRADRRVLIGSLRLGDDQADAPHSAVACLSDQQQLISTAELDELGNFVLDNLLPGTYRLSFRLPDREVIIETLSL